jgi:uncharacterized membrane protein YeaQ/YmgE (transglycosylase-associated protein family)
MVEIIGVITTGIILGFVGKFVAPGSRASSPMCHHFCGIGGVLIGWFICSAFWRRWLSWNRLDALAHCNCGGNSSCRHRFYPDRPQHPGSGDDSPSLKIVRV